MKRKFATTLACFFLILSSRGGEESAVHRYATQADGFHRRTLSRIAEGWIGAKENFRFAIQSLKDKAVTAEREAKARAKLAGEELRDEAVRKTHQIVTDTRDGITETGERIRDEAVTRIRETGREAGGEIRKRVRQGIRDVENSDR